VLSFCIFALTFFKEQFSRIKFVFQEVLAKTAFLDALNTDTAELVVHEAAKSGKVYSVIFSDDGIRYSREADGNSIS